MKGFDPSAILLNPDFSRMLLHGLEMTFVIAIGSWCLAMALALVLLAIRLAPRASSKAPPSRTCLITAMCRRLCN